MSLQEQVEKIAAEYLPDPPQNEADTCHWIVYPLLLACGYAPRDISSQRSDAIREFPDYTLLLNAPQHTWFVEAKAWNVTLEDRHAQQALNYTNSNGKRWVVLTNGRVWRLYDNYCRGVASDKLVVEVLLDNAEAMLRLLSALSKASVCADGLDTYGLKARLHIIIRDNIINSQSGLVNAIAACLRSEYNLESVQNTSITEYFKEMIALRSLPRPSTEVTNEQPPQPVPPIVNKPVAVKSEQQSPLLEFSLSKLPSAKDSVTGKDIVTFKKPVQIKLPGEENWRDCGEWSDLDEKFVRWLHEQNKMPPLPCKISKSKFYINHSPCHVMPSDRMKDHRQLTIGVSSIYVFTHGSATEHVRRLNLLCQQLRVPANKFMIRLRRTQ